MPKHLKIYTDGACSGNPGPGGWAVVIEPPNENDPVEFYAVGKSVDDTTNNAMELKALQYAVDLADWKCENKGDEVTIYTDSMYCLKCATGEWKRKAHINEWEVFDIFYNSLIARGVKVNIEWVKGHNGNKLNTLADELAKAVITTNIQSTV